jgi:hypothetical protein
MGASSREEVVKRKLVLAFAVVLAALGGVAYSTTRRTQARSG